MKSLPRIFLFITMMIDAHIHFERFVNDFKEALTQIESNQIFCAAVSLDFSSYELTLQIANKTNMLLPAFGVHPIQASPHLNQLDLIKEKADSALMLGEIGLDRLYIEKKEDFKGQIPLFEIFLEAAEKHNTIMSIHVAGAEDEAISILEQYKVSNVIIHDYYGSTDLIQKIIDRGYYYSFDRSYLNEYATEIDNWKERREIVRMIPHDLILTETDGPNRPPNRLPFTSLNQVIKNVANLRGCSSDEIISQVNKNFVGMMKRDHRLSGFVKVIERSQPPP